MVKNIRISSIVLLFLIIGLLTGCNLPIDNETAVQSGIEKTLAVFISQTAAASTQDTIATDSIGQTPETPPLNTPNPVFHVIMPGEMQTIESTIDDLLYNGDQYSIDLLERPFTPMDMQNRFDLDLQKVSMSSDNTFFYFSLLMKDINITSKMLDGNYGIEIDTDLDGRGDYLLWAYSPSKSTTWESNGIALFTDTNNDVGSINPLVSDPVQQTDGYESEVWPGKPISDYDGAWSRISPISPTTMQLAVKRSLLGDPTKFLWGAWSDHQIMAPYRFDYNDIFTAAQAGSPYMGNPDYPLKEVAQIDNTCREAWGFKSTGKEPGICKPAVTQQPTVKPNNTPKPTQKPGATPTATKMVITPTTCTDVQVSALVSPWDVAYTSGVTLCVNGSCQNPDSGGYAIWYLPPGTYTISATSNYGITPPSATVTLGCGEKSLSNFTLGPG